MSTEFEPTSAQKAILFQLTDESRKREESLDLVPIEGSNDSIYGFIYQVEKTSQIRNLSREQGVPEKEIARAILKGISKTDRRRLFLINNIVLGKDEINDLAEYFEIDLY